MHASLEGKWVRRVACAALAAAWLDAAGCGETIQGVGGESHFICGTDADCPKNDVCAKPDGGSQGQCVARATARADAPDGSSSAPSNAGGATGSGGSPTSTTRTVPSGGSAGTTPGEGSAGNAASSPASGGSVQGSGSPTSNECGTDCCPTDPSCYSTSAGNGSPGSECLATRDNTAEAHVSLRQTWIANESPAGLAAPSAVYGILAGRTDLNWPTCHLGGNASFYGAGGYVELGDLYLQDTIGRAYVAGDYATLGFSTFAGAALTAAPTFCFGSGDYSGDPMNPKYALGASDMSSTAGWPAGLVPPMPLAVAPWHVAPTTAKRLDSDFDPVQDRVNVLAYFDAGSATYLGPDFTGIFFYDPSSGYFHAFAPLAWITQYTASGQVALHVPAREVEKKGTFNDPAHPDCIGRYLATQATNPDCSSPLTDDTMAAWGGGDCSNSTGHAACEPGQSAYSTTSYSLVTELEQIYSEDLSETLCIAYPGKTDPSFLTSDDSSCKGPSWNPGAPDDSGLPSGDWCAAKNSPATATCHDAYHTLSYQTFAGASIELDSPTGAPSLCAF